MADLTREQVITTIYGGNRSLAGLNLSGLDLTNLSLAGVDFTGCALNGTRFGGATLTGATFTGANARGASFTGARLGKAKLAGVLLERASFADAELADADFSGADLHEVQGVPAFKGAKLNGAWFPNRPDGVAVPDAPITRTPWKSAGSEVGRRSMVASGF